jgi:hypothetical protein
MNSRRYISKYCSVTLYASVGKFFGTGPSGPMSAPGQTLQGIHRQTGPEVRFGPKADLISMLIPGGSCFSPL